MSIPPGSKNTPKVTFENGLLLVGNNGELGRWKAVLRDSEGKTVDDLKDVDHDLVQKLYKSIATHLNEKEIDLKDKDKASIFIDHTVTHYKVAPPGLNANVDKSADAKEIFDQFDSVIRRTETVSKRILGAGAPAKKKETESADKSKAAGGAGRRPDPGYKAFDLPETGPDSEYMDLDVGTPSETGEWMEAEVHQPRAAGVAAAGAGPSDLHIDLVPAVSPVETAAVEILSDRPSDATKLLIGSELRVTGAVPDLLGKMEESITNASEQDKPKMRENALKLVDSLTKFPELIPVAPGKRNDMNGAVKSLLAVCGESDERNRIEGQADEALRAVQHKESEVDYATMRSAGVKTPEQIYEVMRSARIMVKCMKTEMRGKSDQEELTATNSHFGTKENRLELNRIASEDLNEDTPIPDIRSHLEAGANFYEGLHRVTMEAFRAIHPTEYDEVGEVEADFGWAAPNLGFYRELYQDIPVLVETEIFNSEDSEKTLGVIFAALEIAKTNKDAFLERSLALGLLEARRFDEIGPLLSDEQNELLDSYMEDPALKEVPLVPKASEEGERYLNGDLKQRLAGRDVDSNGQPNRARIDAYNAFLQAVKVAKEEETGEAPVELKAALILQQLPE